MAGKAAGGRREERGRISTDSFADIAFLLIIFFMVATTMYKVNALNTDLPAGEQKAQESDEKQPTVLVYPDRIKYNETKVTLDELRQRLAKLELNDEEKREDEDARVVQLEAVDEPPWENYMLVWGAIVKAGGLVAMVEGSEEGE